MQENQISSGGGESSFSEISFGNPAEKEKDFERGNDKGDLSKCRE